MESPRRYNGDGKFKKLMNIHGKEGSMINWAMNNDTIIETYKKKQKTKTKNN